MIKVEGVSLERFLNLAVQNDVRIWSARRLQYTLLTACVSERGYKRIARSLEQTRFTATVEKRKGLPTLWRNAKRRFALFAGLLALLAAIAVLSLFIWEVRVQGVKTLPSETLLGEVRGMGGREGAFKSALDVKEVQKKLLAAHPEIAWLSVRYEGVALVVQVVEATPPPQMVDQEGAADIVAAKDAYIRRIIVLEGRAVVKEGQTVRKGQTLIEGEIFEEGKPRMSFHARGSVTGVIWYAGRSRIPLYDAKKTRTGRTAELRYLQIGNNLVLMDDRDAGFAQCERDVQSVYALGENLFFPVRILCVRLWETKEEKTARDLAAAQVEAEEKAYRDAFGHVPMQAKIVGFDTRFDFSGEILSAICYIKTEEEVGLTKKTP